MKEEEINNLNDMTFEEVLKKLEGDVLNLEKGDLGLEDAINVYENGIKYSDYLMRKLESAEKRVEELSAKNEQHLGKQDFSFSVKPLEID